MAIETAPDDLPGRAKLLKWIRKHYGSVPAYATAFGRDRQKVEKAIAGRLKRIDVPFAFEVQTDTRGAVKVVDWKP